MKTPSAKQFTLASLFFLSMFVSPGIAQDNTMRVHVINVGQGSATLVEFPCGAMLVDTGGENNDEFRSTEALLNYLDEFFQRRPDLNNTISLLMISHPHKDHTFGVKEVTKKYKVKNVITNGQGTGSGRAGQVYLHQLVAKLEDTPDTADNIGFYESITEHIPNGGATSAVIDPFDCGEINPEVRILWGQVLSNPGWSKDDYDDENNHSVVCKIDYGQASIIMTGDLEIKAIGALLAKHTATGIFDSDVYLVGHHGSKNGTTDAFLQAITPEIAVLSFGDYRRELPWTAWAYGHPNKNIVKQLASKVSSERSPVKVIVGNGKKKFQRYTLSKGLYGTGWDSTIVLTAKTDGTWASNRREGIININDADAIALATLPSIGERRARAIVEFRNRQGRFTTVDDLVKVPGIGPATVALLRPLVRI
ncbi:MAG: MBL fold metallo-hydrolase [Bacteroidia bacterium]|nr:MBL fold metallo-hydrolase [Bacteroidia bacterium]